MLKVLGMVLTCLCVSVPAHAVDGLIWNWDKPKRFLLISDVNAPEFLLWQAEFIIKHASLNGVQISWFLRAVRCR